MSQLTQAAEDAIVTAVLQRLGEKDLTGSVLRSMKADDRQLVEDCVDRHSARQRAAGKRGW